MKILICGTCGDFVKLRPRDWSRCTCGVAGGAYHGRIDAYYTGPQNTFLIGFHAGSFETVVQRDRRDRQDGIERDLGHEFKAFTIPWNASTVTRIPHDRVLQEGQEDEAAAKAREIGGVVITFNTRDEPPGLMYVVVEADHEGVHDDG